MQKTPRSFFGIEGFSVRGMKMQYAYFSFAWMKDYFFPATLAFLSPE